MRLRVGAIGLVVAAMALLTGPVAGAAASPGFEVQESSLRLNLTVKGSNGFRGFIATEGHKQVSLTLIKGGVLMDLRTNGTVSRDGIVARFGDLGKVSVRFQGERPSAEAGPRRQGQRGDPTPGCSGRDPIVERGHFRGTIQFQGENDFTRINAGLAPGTVEQHFRRVCKESFQAALNGLFEELFSGLRVDMLEAHARVDGANVAFEAASFDLSSILGPGTPPTYGFSGRTMEWVDGMRIIRAANVEETDSGFFAGKPGAMPQNVTVVPPKPLLESAKYRKEAGVPATWVGPLAARLPGAGLVPLTGPSFKSAFCGLTVKRLIAGERCLGRQSEPEPHSLATFARGAAHGSGSQSQAFWDVRLSWSR